MTRGTFYVILSNKTLRSAEFNGDMYGSSRDDPQFQESGHYPLAIEMLKRVRSAKDFRQMILDFDEQAGFRYFSDSLEKPVFSDYFGAVFTKKRKVVFDKKTYFDYFFSDYLFLKNLSKKSFTFIDMNKKVIVAEPNDIVTFYFGEFIERFSMIFGLFWDRYYD